MSMIITVDGPGGTGKSTVSRLLAERAGLPHLDTGAFYRAATLAVLEAGVDPYDEAGVIEVVSRSDLEQEDGRMYLDGRDVSAEIREERVTSAVSAVSAHPGLRRMLVEAQRAWVERHGGGVIEGRDIGSVVFPEAPFKFYLDASPEVRARRRADQTGESYDEVLEDLRRRDRIDSTRAASPLVVPDGAMVIDTSNLSVEEVVETMLEAIEAKS
ncbi:MAG TPA: (d)CMP kinase [Acidimicrobiia bacterium]|jgi:cytidylate kinase|nr:(d)CMP kinase [Acidimicrobiia bacterium]